MRVHVPTYHVCVYMYPPIPYGYACTYACTLGQAALDLPAGAIATCEEQAVCGDCVAHKWKEGGTARACEWALEVRVRVQGTRVFLL